MCSVLEQDYANIEYLIVDGASTDGSVEIIEKYADRLAWWVSEADRGQTDAINKGFARATGEILAWLNSDDTYEPGAISEAVAFLQTHPKIGLVYGDTNFVDADLSNANLFDADFAQLQYLQNANFSGANLTKTYLEADELLSYNVVLDGAIMSDGTVYK